MNNGRLGMARAKYTGWQLLSKLGFGTVYFQVISEGWRLVIPFTGTRLYQIPFLGWLRDFEETYRLDVAHVVALALLVFVFQLLGKSLELWLVRVPDGPWHPAKYLGIVVLLTILVVGADAWFFYLAIGQMSWGGSESSSQDVLATVAWVAMLVTSSFVSLFLHQQVKQLTPEYRK